MPPAKPRRERAMRRRRAIRRDPQCGGDSLRTRRPRGQGRRSGQLVQEAPPIGLTFRAMTGTCQRPAPRGGRPLFGLVSLLALLAMACFPVFAHAEGSAGIQYEPAPPSATPHGSQSPSPHSEPKANSSGSSNGGAPAPSGSSHSGSSKKKSPSHEESKVAGGTGASGGGGNGGHNQSSQGKNAGNAEVSRAKEFEQPAPQQGNGGGSSPVVPILIVVALLAAISIGAYVYRQRRHRRDHGASFTPEAG
jgi:cobalamin biosynthesis Mg chelatase CobN